MLFEGAMSDFHSHLTLNGANIQWTDEWKYLGVVLKSGKRFGCSVKDRVKSFYRSLLTLCYAWEAVQMI